MAKRPAGKLRIIGGEWRSRVVEFEADSGVRPTPDRVRQTLFDWLSPVIEGARCLDLFAGSGALGLEALSRGAAHVTFVDSGAAQAARIRGAVQALGGSARAEVVTADALAYLDTARARFDVVFLDPPFGGALLGPALERLPRVLRPGNRVYVESRQGTRAPLPVGFDVLREKKAGQVSYALTTLGGAPA